VAGGDRLLDDERFKDGGLARGRVPVADALVYAIRLSDFECDAEMRAALKEIADRDGLALNVHDGEATLRQQPNVNEAR
jgi:hypothetical protein